MKNRILEERKQIRDERNPKIATEYLYEYLSHRFTNEDIIAIANALIKKVQDSEPGEQ